MRKYKFLFPVLALALIVVAATMMFGNVAASTVSSPTLIAQGSQNSSGAALAANPSTGRYAQPVLNDGFDTLPVGLKGVSYSTLAMSGKVHPPKAAPSQPSSWVNPFAPLLNITWGAATQTTASASGEPAAGVNPTNGQYLLVSGNFSIDNSTNGGTTWQSRNPPNPANSGDVTNAWLEGGPGPAGANALELSINNNGGGYDYTCGRSTDFGVTWATDAACGPSVSTPYFDDREYIWVDHNPSSPFYGRVYVTTALFDAGGTGSFNTVSNRYSTDNGTSWNPPSNTPLALVPNNEFATGVAHNEYASLGISPNGTLGYAWRRGLCCGDSPTVGTNNKVMFARSTDGGASFTFSTTIVTVPLANAVPFNSTSPLGVRWSDTPNITADLGQNGVFYAVWTAYRTANTKASAAIYLSKSTDNGATWSAPIIPYNNPNANIFQGFGWVKVTPDHTIHLTYLSGTTNNTTVAQFYVQSTDGGATWSAPFQLSSSTFGAFGTTTDYEANDIGGFSNGGGTILAGWAQNNHWARVGTFTLGTPTPTVTGTPPTNTPTNTPTLTPTVTPTPCLSPNVIQNPGFETGSLPPWTILGANNPPAVSTAQAHSGTHSALLGTLSGGEPNGDSSIYETVTVPLGNPQLSYYYWPFTTDTISFDWQDAYVVSTTGTILATVMHVDENTQAWTNKTFDMSPYAGQTVRIEFLVHEDGFGDDTAMYVDDVSLQSPVSCATNTPGPPTATATSTATSTPAPPTATATSQPTNTATNTPAVPTATSTPAAPTPTATQCPSSGLSPSPRIVGKGKPAANPGHPSGSTLKLHGSSHSQGQPAAQPLTQLVLDPSFELGTPNPDWTEASTNFGTPLCDATSCGTGGGTAGPNTGNWWAWFGGTPNLEDGSVSQAVTIPAGTATLQFYLWIGAHSGNGAADYIHAMIDNTAVFTATDADTAYDSGYVAVQVDISAYADGGSHTLAMVEHNDASGTGININVDDVTIEATAGLPCPTLTPTAAATATATAVATDTPVATNTPGGATDTPVATDTPAATNTPGGPTNTPAAPTVTPTDCPNPFVDITGNVFYGAIHYLNCRGVINGVDATHYGPGGTSTRGQFAKVVVLGFGIPLSTPTGGQSFTDVPPSYFAYVYIESGFANGILNGFDAAGCTSHGATFPCYLPNLAITRGQLTKLVVSAGHYALYTPTTPDFIDVPTTNVFYVSIETAFHNSVIAGYPDHTFRPNNNIRRDEMAQIVFEGIVHMP